MVTSIFSFSPTMFFRRCKKNTVLWYMVNPGVQLAYIYFFMLCINKTSTNNQKFP